jgi:hypothetical protein
MRTCEQCRMLGDNGSFTINRATGLGARPAPAPRPQFRAAAAAPYSMELVTENVGFAAVARKLSCRGESKHAFCRRQVG